MTLFFNPKDLCLVVPLVTILSFASFARAQESVVPVSVASEADGEAVKRLEQTMLLTKLTDEAGQLLAAGSVEPARTRYQQVLNQTQTTGPSALLNVRASKGMGAISALQARQAMDKRDYVQSRQLWEQALGYDSANTAYQAAYEQVKQKSKSVVEQYPGNTAATQDLQDKINQIQKLIFEGDSFVQTGQYDRAVARYKTVLIIDSYNDQARQRIKKAEQTMEQVATIRRKQRKDSAMNQVKRALVIQPQATVEQTNSIAVGDVTSTNVANVYDKLQGIVIPECNFTDADLADILNYLQDQSKVIDPKKEGVNFVFKGEPTSSGEIVAAGTPATSPMQMTRSLTLALKDVSLIKILDFIQNLSSYKYKVEEHVIYVFPNTETSEVMLVRTFSVPPNFFDVTVKINDVSVNALGAKTVSIATADVKKELSDKGVRFVSGASAAYLPKTAKLVVRNTLDQLNLIDQLLSREANVSTQVEISTKFLEFSEDKLKDLSVNYRTQVNPKNPINFTSLPNGTAIQPNQTGGVETITAANGETPLNFSNYFPQPAATTGDFGYSTAVRNSSNLMGNPLDSLLGMDINRTPNMISFTGIVDGVGVQMLLTALDSQLGADLMSEPKITLFNGKKSKIRAVRELRYPTQWDAPKIPTSSGGGNGGSNQPITIIPSNPTNFLARDIGVTLEVTANATPDRRIDLNIKPEVTEFQGFVNYGGNATTLNGEGDMVTVVQGVALTPVFSLRSVETQMQVIDGQTVVMGGFIRSDNQDIEDKVPVLGDIPLVGRMFRSKSSQVVKRNLVIFLTARMIRPDGRYEYMTEGEKELSEVTSLPVTQARQ
jgi:general secretion pathway protein D